MDNLREIIHTFSEEDVKKFGFFINRSRAKTGRKDLELFDILLEAEEYKPKTIIDRLYGNDTEKEAYHALRKRLLKHLTDYIVLRNIDEEQTSTSTIMRDISLSQYLLSTQHFPLSFKYLKKAEKQALETEQFDVLNSIYNYMIEYYEAFGIQDLEALITARESNRILLTQVENASIAYSLVKHQLNRFRLQGAEIEIDRIVEDVLERFQIREVVFTRPRLMYKLASITRSAIKAKKDYHSFEPFIIQHYQMLKTMKAFTPKTAFYQLSFLYMIAHTLYRNKKFETSQKYLEELHTIMKTGRKSLYNEFRIRYLALLAANDVFLEGPERSAHFIDNILQDKTLRLSNEEKLNFLISSGIYYFMAGDYATCHERFFSIQHTDKWCEKIMGKEWVFKKNLIEVILFYEMDKIEVVESRIRSIERNFSDFFSNPVYARARIFLSLIKQVVMYPDKITGSEFKDKVEQSFEWLPQEQEDLQAMSFYAWLKSKMEKRDYMEVLQELVTR